MYTETPPTDGLPEFSQLVGKAIKLKSIFFISTKKLAKREQRFGKNINTLMKKPKKSIFFSNNFKTQILKYVDYDLKSLNSLVINTVVDNHIAAVFVITTVVSHSHPFAATTPTESSQRTASSASPALLRTSTSLSPSQPPVAVWHSLFPRKLHRIS